MYNGEHSITFGTVSNHVMTNPKNTWTDWCLIPLTRPVIASSPINTEYIEIPGRDGRIDASEWVPGTTTYGNCEGTWDFYVDNTKIGWETAKQLVMDYLHGKQHHCMLSDQSDKYYVGRFKVTNLQPDKNFSKISIGYVLYPEARSV